MTELEAINRMLSAIGQAPVTTVDETNPDVAICKRTLYQVSQEVQSEGWTFNTYFCEKVTPDPDNNNKIVIRAVAPTDATDYCIQMDLSYNTFYSRDKESIAKADGTDVCLYDKTAQSYDWGTEPIEVDKIMYLANLGTLPPAAYNYIVARASAAASMRTVGDTNQYQILREQELFARTQLQQYETSQGDYTFFGHPQGQNYYTSYQPYHTLSR